MAFWVSNLQKTSNESVETREWGTSTKKAKVGSKLTNVELEQGLEMNGTCQLRGLEKENSKKKLI